MGAGSKALIPALRLAPQSFGQLPQQVGRSAIYSLAQISIHSPSAQLAGGRSASDTRRAEGEPATRDSPAVLFGEINNLAPASKIADLKSLLHSDTVKFRQPWHRADKASNGIDFWG